MNIARRHFLNLAAGAVAMPAVSRLAHADTYPSRAVHVIVPQAAASSGKVVSVESLLRWNSHTRGDVSPAVFIPLAVIALEPTRRRKLMMAPFALTGAAIAGVLLAAMIRGPISVTLAPYHLSYGIKVSDSLLVIALYVAAVCGPLLLSGYRNVAIFGIVNLVAVIIIARLTISGFASVWCGWAAVSSAAITLHCRFAKPGPAPRPARS